MVSPQDKVWLRLWKENSPELRSRVILWRKQDAVTRIEKPSRILREDDSVTKPNKES